MAQNLGKMYFEEISLKVIYNGENVKMTIYPWDDMGKFTQVDIDYFIGSCTNSNFVDIPLIEICEVSPGIFSELSRVEGLATPFSVIEKVLVKVQATKEKAGLH